MEAGILCSVLATKIDPAKFCLHGLEVHWNDEIDNTPENQAIINDVIANYDTYALPFIKSEQIRIIKNQMRVQLALAIGDYGDNIADISRALALSEGIRNGSITDQTIIDGYAQYCQATLDMYGGPQAVLDVLNTDLQGMLTYLAPYYPAKDDVNSATDASQATSVVVKPKVNP
jgi:hypothetical protein